MENYPHNLKSDDCNMENLKNTKESSTLPEATNFHDSEIEKNFEIPISVAESIISSDKLDFQTAEKNVASEVGETEASEEKMSYEDLKVKIEDIEEYRRSENTTAIGPTEKAPNEEEMPESAVFKAENMGSPPVDSITPPNVEESMEQETIVVEAGSELSDIDTTITNLEVITEKCKNSEEKNVGLAEAKKHEKSSSPMKICDSEEAKNFEEAKIEERIDSLALLAQAYENSDSENDEPSCVWDARNEAKENKDEDVTITKEYRNKPETATSEEEESDEDEDSSEISDSSSSEAESQDEEEPSKKCGKKNERNKYKAGQQERETKGEYDDLPPIEELKISVPEVLCDPLGEVGWMVEQMVVVKPKPGKPTLNLDTILFVERGRRVLGRIFDVFGQVSEPHYCVRFNSNEHIKESDIKVGMIVYFCPNTEYTSVVFLHDLLKMRATDEIGDDEHPEFSDDEEERAYYAALKTKQKTDKTKIGEIPQKRQRTDNQDPSWKSNHPWSTSKKQQHTKKFVKSPYKTNERSINQQQQQQQQQQQAAVSSPTWQQYSSSPITDANHWPIVDPNYCNVDWQTNNPPPMQNQYCYNPQYDNRHQQHLPSARPFFRPPRQFATGHQHYGQNRSYRSSTLTNTSRFPNVNFPWQINQGPRLQNGFSWSQPPPPPPPPGI